LRRRYVIDPVSGSPLVWYEGADTSDRRWYHTDERGSVIATSNSSGTMLTIDSYDEYGIPASTNTGRFGYTGQAWLPELGMWYYRARIYSPTLGRFMQTDPIGYGDGMNVYAYVHNDPINLIDPTGLACDFTPEELANSITVCGARPGSGGGSGSNPSLPPQTLINEDLCHGPFSARIKAKYCRNRIESVLDDLQSLIRNGVCSALSNLPESDRLRFGADGAVADGGAFRVGLGISIDRHGQLWGDLYAGFGIGAALSSALGFSYVINAPTQSQVSATGNGSLGVGPVGGNVQTGIGSGTGEWSSSGSVNLGGPILPGGRVGVEATATINGEITERIGGRMCG
jgi:RHS repeat-associated protein